MIRPTSKSRYALTLNDYQVFKGQCDNTMRPFGQPVCAVHEAKLLISDDRSKMAAGAIAKYAIHQRSENKITTIIYHRIPAVMLTRPEKSSGKRLAIPLRKAS